MARSGFSRAWAPTRALPTVSRSFPGDALPAWLEERGLVSRADLGRARNRQRVYGGALDTALLELGLCDEATLRQALQDATGLPAAAPAWLGNTGRAAARLMNLATARKLSAQAVADAGEHLEVVAGAQADLDAVTDWAAREHDRGCRFHLAPQLHFEALMARVHQAPLTSRFLRLLAHYEEQQSAAGRERLPQQAASLAEITQLARTMARRPRVVPRPPVETGPMLFLPTTEAPPAMRGGAQGGGYEGPHESMYDALIDVSEDLTDADALAELLNDQGTVASATATGQRAIAAASVMAKAVNAPLGPDAPTAAQPTFAMAAARTQARAKGVDAVAAIERLAELCDAGFVPELIGFLQDENPEVVQAAARALARLTAQDFGTTRWRWTLWWRTWGKRHRVEWLLDALSATAPERRLQAAQELERITGHYVGYHFDLGRRDREAARRRWERWWQETGRAQLDRSS